MVPRAPAVIRYALPMGITATTARRALAALSVVAVGLWSVASCSSNNCGPLGILCSPRLVSSPCEIVSFTTDCGSSIRCQHGACFIGENAMTETCTVIAHYDDNTSAISHVTVSTGGCGCAQITASSFVPPKGSTCSPPKSDIDASVLDASDGSASDALNDSPVDATGQ